MTMAGRGGDVVACRHVRARRGRGTGMTGFPFTITVTPPGSLKLAAGEKGTFSFTLTSLAGPDRTYELLLVPLWIGPDRKGVEVDWLAAGPADLRMAGGETATATLTARPSATSPLGVQTIKLRVARKDDPNELFVDSSPVTCEVLASPSAPPPPARRRWWIPAIIAGAVLVAGAGGVLAWKLRSHHGLGEPCGDNGACDKDLVCAAASNTCLLAGGKPCDPAKAQCATGVCDGEAHVCAIAIGSACNPDDGVPCADKGHCDAASKTCKPADCTPGAQQCTPDGAGLSTCDAGVWKTAPCPSNAPKCRDGKCQCVANIDQQCGDCGGKVLCDGSCSKADHPDTGKSCGCGGTTKCDGSCSKPNDPNTGKSCGCGGTTLCDGSCSKPNHPDTSKPCGCGGITRCDGSCSKPSHPETGKPCGCNGTTPCDGSCRKPTHPDTNKPCGCGGTTQCDGTCNKPNDPNTGKPCGDCGGRTQCDGKCSITTPRCPAGFVVDASAPGFCRSTEESENYSAEHSFGGLLGPDKCDPCGCDLNTDKIISLSCGAGRVHSSFDVRRVRGKPGDCSGGWLRPNDPNDCSVRVHIGTRFCDNFICAIAIRSLERRRQCTN
jgi:hypothetical protein